MTDAGRLLKQLDRRRKTFNDPTFDAINELPLWGEVARHKSFYSLAGLLEWAQKAIDEIIKTIKSFQECTKLLHN